MKIISKTFKSAVSIAIVVMMLFNMAVITSAARSLDANLEWSNDFASGIWNDVSGTSVYSVSDFEPGSEAVRYFKISNPGSLAFSYDFKFSADAELGKLADVIDVYYISDVSENVSVAEMSKLYFSF